LARRRDAWFSGLEQGVAKRGVALMGVCNVTPDSFSDGGAFFTRESACARIDALVAEGADLIDVGGESTRPGAPAIPAREQIARVIDVVRYAATKAPVSIDTQDPEVARACLDAGASAVNDVSCLRDERLARAVADAGAAYVLMHARATQTEMRGFSTYPDDAYGDVVADVAREWAQAAARARTQGVAASAIAMDPGLGFAKNARHSAQILRRIGELARAVSAPVVVGASRKSFLTLVDAGAPPSERIGASIAAAAFAAERGAKVLRVHDVRATRQAIDVLGLLRDGPAGAARASVQIQPSGAEGDRVFQRGPADA